MYCKIVSPPKLLRQNGILGEPPPLERHNRIDIIERIFDFPDYYIITNIDEPIRLKNGMSAINILFSNGESYDISLCSFLNLKTEPIKTTILHWEKYSKNNKDKNRICIFCLNKANVNSVYCKDCNP